MINTITIKRLTSVASNYAAKLRTLWSPLWRLLTFGADNIILPKKSLCISIEKAAISLAYGTRFLTRIKINALRKYPLKEEGYPRPEELASTIPLVVSELKAVKAEITLNIPKKWVVIKKVELPITAKENLKGVMSYEMDRLTPFSSEEALYDFKTLKEDDKNIIILLVAVRADLANKYMDLLRGKGIYVSRLSVNLSGIGCLSHYIERNRDSIFVEIDENEYEGALFTDGSIAEVFRGNFPQGNDSSSEIRKVETILKEIAPLAETAKKERQTPQLMISLKNIAPSFGEMLKQGTDLPVKIFAEIDIKLRYPQGQKHLPYAAIGGVLEELCQSEICWGGKAKGFNLLKKGVHERQKTPLFFTIIFLLIIAALWLGYTLMPLKIEEKRLGKIDSGIAIRKGDIKKFEWLTKDIEEIQKEISDIRSLKESRPMALDILRELTTILPKNAWLTRMHITENMAEVEGYAGSATGLLQKLETSRYFKKVELLSPAFKDIKKGVDRFSIRMEIEGAKKKETTTKGLEEGVVDEGF
ncbi:MAG: PilN domain-containing protein [Thermodesulfovibrionia bacterium]|nr:PilN domain-containing protein [Thermodesulfovibrionia bacterium]